MSVLARTPALALAALVAGLSKADEGPAAPRPPAHQAAPSAEPARAQYQVTEIQGLPVQVFPEGSRPPVFVALTHAGDAIGWQESLLGRCADLVVLAGQNAAQLLSERPCENELVDANADHQRLFRTAATGRYGFTRPGGKQDRELGQDRWPNRLGDSGRLVGSRRFGQRELAAISAPYSAAMGKIELPGDGPSWATDINASDRAVGVVDVTGQWGLRAFVTEAQGRNPQVLPRPEELPAWMVAWNPLINRAGQILTTWYDPSALSHGTPTTRYLSEPDGGPARPLDLSALGDARDWDFSIGAQGFNAKAQIAGVVRDRRSGRSGSERAFITGAQGRHPRFVDALIPGWQGRRFDTVGGLNDRGDLLVRESTGAWFLLTRLR